MKKGYLEKLFVDGVISCEKPGFIGVNTRGTVEGESPMQRFIWCSEDLLIFLQNATIDFIGEKRTSDLWYRIGKETAIRYFLFPWDVSGGIKSSFDFIAVLMEHLSGVGWSAAEDVFFDRENLVLILRGRENAICYKTSNSSFFLGLISGYMTFLFNKNIEACSECSCCPKNCKIIASCEIHERCLIDVKSLEPSKKYSDYNCDHHLPDEPELSSFSDFIKFKKIIFEENNVFFMNKKFLPFEVGSYGIFFKNYEKLGLGDFMRNVLIDCVENLSCYSFSDLDLDMRIIRFRNLLSVFGYGIPFLEVRGGDVHFKLLGLPFSKYGFDFQISIINGFVNLIFEKKYILKEKVEDVSHCSISLVFSER